LNIPTNIARVSLLIDAFGWQDSVPQGGLSGLYVLPLKDQKWSVGCDIPQMNKNEL
jgi:hypothetical protein